METNQIGLALYCIVQTKLSVIAITRIDIIQNDVLYRRSVNLSSFNLRRQDHRLCAKEVLNILHTKCSLNSQFCGTKILVSIKRVHPHNNICGVTMDLLELINNKTDSHRNTHLKRCDRVSRSKRSLRLQEGIKIAHDLALQFVKESLIRSLDSHSRTELINRLDGNSLCVFLKNNVLIRNRFYLKFSVRDFLTLTYGSATLQCLRLHRSLIGSQLCTRCFSDRAHDAENLSQSIPVLAESGYEIQFTDSNCNIIFYCKTSFCRHFLTSYFLKYRITRGSPP